MTALTILDRVNDGDYEGLHPVEYAIPIRPDSRKAKEIEQVMGHVRKKVRQNAEESRSAMSGRIHEATGEYLKDYPKIGEEYKKFLDENRTSPGNYAMAISEDALNHVMNEDGKFKNQFEIGKSLGSLDYDFRARTSNRNFGTKYKKKEPVYTNGSAIPDWILNRKQKSLVNSEKYGFAKNSSSRDLPNSVYGEYTIEFNPANMEHRTTISMDDSLDSPFYPVLLDESETWPGMLGDRNKVEMDYTKRRSPYSNGTHALITHGRAHAKYKNEGYNELQFHGPLDLSDVDAIHVPKIGEENEYGIFKRSQVRSDIPDQWIMQAEINNFDIVDDQGNLIYQCSAHKGKQ